MRVFAVPVALLLVTAAAVGCERVAPTTPEVGALSPAFATSSGIVLQEPGFAAVVLADRLAFPQGALQLGRGVLFVTASDGLPVALSQVREIIRVLPSGKKNTFAVLPPTGTIVDLVFDPVRGLFASIIPGTGDPQPTIWHVRLSGDVTPYPALARAPTFLAFDPQGRLVVNQAVGDVVRIEADRSLTTLVDANPANTRLRGIAFDANGRLYDPTHDAAHQHHPAARSRLWRAQAQRGGSGAVEQTQLGARRQLNYQYTGCGRGEKRSPAVDSDVRLTRPGLMELGRHYSKASNSSRTLREQSLAMISPFSTTTANPVLPHPYRIRRIAKFAIPPTAAAM